MRSFRRRSELGHVGSGGLQILVRVLRKQVSGRGRLRGAVSQIILEPYPLPYSCHPTGRKWIAECSPSCYWPPRAPVANPRPVAPPPTRPRRERLATAAGARWARRRPARQATSRRPARDGGAGAQPAGKDSGARVSRDRGRQEHALHADRRELQGRSRGRVQARLSADHDRADARQGLRERPAGDVAGGVRVRRRVGLEQFRYIERNGKLEIDPTSGVGIWLDFAKTHPGWKNRAVFCMLNGGAAGHNFFGDKREVRGPEEGVAPPESEMARRPGLRAVLAHAVAREAEQVSGRRGPGADRAQRDGDRLGGGGLQGADDGASVRASGRRTGSSRGRDRWTDPEDRARRTATSSTRCSRSRADRRGARTIRSSIRRASTASRRSAPTSAVT